MTNNKMRNEKRAHELPYGDELWKFLEMYQLANDAWIYNKQIKTTARYAEQMRLP